MVGQIGVRRDMEELCLFSNDLTDRGVKVNHAVRAFWIASFVKVAMVSIPCAAISHLVDQIQFHPAYRDAQRVRIG